MDDCVQLQSTWLQAQQFIVLVLKLNHHLIVLFDNLAVEKNMRPLCHLATAVIVLVSSGCNIQANPDSAIPSGQTAIATFAGGCF